MIESLVSTNILRLWHLSRRTHMHPDQVSDCKINFLFWNLNKKQVTQEVIKTELEIFMGRQLCRAKKGFLLSYKLTEPVLQIFPDVCLLSSRVSHVSFLLPPPVSVLSSAVPYDLCKSAWLSRGSTDSAVVCLWADLMHNSWRSGSQLTWVQTVGSPQYSHR